MRMKTRGVVANVTAAEGGEGKASQSGTDWHAYIV